MEKQTQSTIQEKYSNFIQSKPFAIFMKGNPQFPMCGFSARTLELLFDAGVAKEDLAHFDILEDEAMRTAAKELSQWPTYPQVFIQGEFVGGCDIIVDLHERGELSKLVQNAKAK